jgi:uncharacterized protein
MMQAPPTPCINVCRMDRKSGLCEGCLRTLDEIAAWGSANPRQKMRILQAVDHRRQQLKKNEDQAQ